MGVLEQSVWISARPEQVWPVYADPRRIPEWQTGSPVILDVQGMGGTAGSTYVSRRRPGSASTVVMEAEQPRRLVTRTQAYLGLRFDVISRLEAEADGTRLSLRAETRWPRGLGLLGRLVELAILNSREAERELTNLKTLVESETRN